MKQAFNSQILKNDDGKPIGIFTGSDHCAEHEWGIADLHRYLGMDKSLLGVAKRTNRDGKNVHFAKSKIKIKGVVHNMAILVFGSPVAYGDIKTNDRYTLKRIRDSYSYSLDKDRLHCEWDDKGCLVAVVGEENVKLLSRLYESAQSCKLFLTICGTGPFNNGGLTIIDIDDIPQKDKDNMLAIDLDAIKLKEASLATGIEAKLKATQTSDWNYPASGCKWMALSPRWLKETEKEKANTKYPVVYWLNPESQDKVNCGWFTVEDLKDWIKGVGKIPKNTQSTNK